MIVDMILMGMVEPPVMHTIEMRPVLDHLMAVARLVAGMAGDRHFRRRVGLRDGEHMLVGMAGVHVVEMAVVQIVAVPGMGDRHMAAARGMAMILMPAMDHFMRSTRCGSQSSSSRQQYRMTHANPFQHLMERWTRRY
jgi:hypothetical protein